jgi:hypothetical protein
MGVVQAWRLRMIQKAPVARTQPRRGANGGDCCTVLRPQPGASRVSASRRLTRGAQGGSRRGAPVLSVGQVVRLVEQLAMLGILGNEHLGRLGKVSWRSDREATMTSSVHRSVHRATVGNGVKPRRSSFTRLASTSGQPGGGARLVRVLRGFNRSRRAPTVHDACREIPISRTFAHGWGPSDLPASGWHSRGRRFNSGRLHSAKRVVSARSTQPRTFRLRLGRFFGLVQSINRKLVPARYVVDGFPAVGNGR